ncbi:putative transporter [Neolecta irregularis DAH-3]|uniref:Putative transporter n=1 Tax=Neolecta irregularis (strain DAH-3) TaxID=1198029 RepID=A0A1U7LQQ8_NEOID|nr:putative transporter [Neolecta irregularis DAH-3]|eukprot:OLL24851.1 putative transporter [Neolecta irregularis DAH-3]
MPAVFNGHSLLFIALCLLWFAASSMTGVSSKAVLTAMPAPVSLTIAQFASAALCAFAFAFAPLSQSLLHSKPHSAAVILRAAAPLSVFQVAGHVFGSLATAKLSVSTVQTVKALSPLFTVAADRFLFCANYSSLTYLSLFPLTAGVVAACSQDLSAHPLGLVCALLSALVFVAQNLLGKKVLSPDSPAKIDHLSLIFYSSAIAFCITLPVWLYCDVLPFLLRVSPVSIAVSPLYLGAAFFFNGLCHFAQNVLAFALLSITSPVSYSIASLIKRIFIIVFSILWFRQPTRPVQALGILSTFFGLYLYDRAKLVSKSRDALLPVSEKSQPHPSRSSDN